MVPFAEVTIKDLGQLIEQCTPTERDPVSGRLRNYSVFRGSNHIEDSLLTSLDRLGGTQPPHSKAHLEEHLLRNFIRYARPYLKDPGANDWELLITSQHHGLPTRLLDWSHSPLVAAHFASAGPQNEDRVIWKLDWPALHKHFNLKPLAFLVSDLNELITQKGWKSAWDFFDSDNHREFFVCMLEPPAIDERLKVQGGAFTLASLKTMSLDQMLHKHGIADCLSQVIIPADRVALIRDQLDMCSLDERHLFPGLDGIASGLTRYYSASAIPENSGRAE